MSKDNSGIPWPVWAIVMILVALIGAYPFVKDPPPVSPPVSPLVPKPVSINLTGVWSDVTHGHSRNCFIAQNGTSLIVRIGKRGPFQGSYDGLNAINVNFTDDPGCCKALIEQDGKVLQWDNGVKWVKE